MKPRRKPKSGGSDVVVLKPVLPDKDQVRHYVNEILGTPRFARSPRLSRFLNYTVEHVLNGEKDQIREYNVAVDVFDRDDSFDPRLESVVRVEARRLRQLLHEYYESEGQDDEIAIEIPTGTYVPLCDGISEEITDGLAQLAGLRVVASTSSFAFRKERPDAREIGKKLGAEWLLEGSVRKSGEAVRVSARLVRASDGFQVRTVNHQGLIAEIFEIQDGIRRAVIEEFMTFLDPRLLEAPRPYRSDSRKAYEHFVAARHSFALQTESGLQKAASLFRDATSADPGYADAFAGLSRTYHQLGLLCMLPASTALKEAKEAAERAIALNKSSGEAHAAMAAVVGAYEHDWDASSEEFQQAVWLSPNSAMCRKAYALFHLLPHRQFEAAFLQMNRASEIDPISPIFHVYGSWACYLSGDADGTILHASTILETHKDHVLGHVLLGLGLELKEDYRDALLALKRAHELGPEMSFLVGSLGHACAKAGDIELANTLLESLKSKSWGRPCDMAIVNAGLGNRRRALRHLEQSFEEGCARLIWLRVEPRFAEFRSEPSFGAVVQKMGLGV